MKNEDMKNEDDGARHSQQPEPECQAEMQPTSGPSVGGAEPPVPAESRPPRFVLLEYQLNWVVRNSWVAGPKREALRKGTLDLYKGLDPRDTTDSIFAALTVGLHNQTMECIGRNTGNPQTDELRLKYSIRGAAVIEKLLKYYHSRRRGPAGKE